MTVIPVLAHAMAPWAKAYRDSKAVETLVTFAHVGGMLASGGLALGADRTTLRLAHTAPGHRREQLRELAAVHRPVLFGLAVVALSGLALFAADVETFAGSVVFWVKMALIVALLVNALRMRAAERRLATADGDVRAWRALRATAWASLVLWFGTAFAGVWLVNAA